MSEGRIDASFATPIAKGPAEFTEGQTYGANETLAAKVGIVEQVAFETAVASVPLYAASDRDERLREVQAIQARIEILREAARVEAEQAAAASILADQASEAAKAAAALAASTAETARVEKEQSVAAQKALDEEIAKLGRIDSKAAEAERAKSPAPAKGRKGRK